jgi:hypothetical protein
MPAMNAAAPDFTLSTVLVEQVDNGDEKAQFACELADIVARAIPHPPANSEAELALALELSAFCRRVIKRIGRRLFEVQRPAFDRQLEDLRAEKAASEDSGWALACSQFSEAVSTFGAFVGRLGVAAEGMTAESVIEALDSPQGDAQVRNMDAVIDDSMRKIALLVLTIVLGRRTLLDSSPEFTHWACRAVDAARPVSSMLCSGDARQRTVLAYLFSRWAWSLWEPS